MAVETAVGQSVARDDQRSDGMGSEKVGDVDALDNRRRGGEPYRLRKLRAAMLYGSIEAFRIP